MLTNPRPEAAAPATDTLLVARRGAPPMSFDGTRVPTGRGASSMKCLVSADVIVNAPGDPLWSPPV